jgi:hypothetical protein
MGVGSVAGSSSPDSGARGWIESTISAAESSAREANNQVWETRTDGVDDPPQSAPERALDAFWANDPNRPASTTPGAGSGGDTSSGSGDGPNSGGGTTTAGSSSMPDGGGSGSPSTGGDHISGPTTYVINPGGESITQTSISSINVTVKPPPPPPFLPSLADPYNTPPATPSPPAPAPPPSSGPISADPIAEPEQVAKKPTKADIDKAIKAGDYKKAVELAAKLLGIKAVYDPKISGEGVVGPDGELRIGKNAFTFVDTSTGKSRPATAGWVMSAIEHESVHQSQREPGPSYRWGRDGTQGGIINQAESYKTELDHARKNGLKQPEIDELERRYNEQLELLRPPYRQQVERGDFSVPEIYQNPPEN